MSELIAEKYIWTEDDFDKMGWHDATLYATAFLPEQYELLLDIDYIFEWTNPEDNETYYKFLVSPATLVFENVNELSINLTEPYRAIQIQNIERKNSRKPKNADYVKSNIEWQWIIDIEVGEITFYSIGYKQFIRKEPMLINSQSLSFDERRGLSFFRGKI